VHWSAFGSVVDKALTATAPKCEGRIKLEACTDKQGNNATGSPSPRGASSSSLRRESRSPLTGRPRPNHCSKVRYRLGGSGSGATGSTSARQLLGLAVVSTWKLRGASHVSGLLTRSMTAGPDVIRGSGPIQFHRLEAQ
jgi:hypothetical protein